MAAVLAVAGFAAAGTAQARERYRDGDDDAVIAIGAGIVGLAIGAALADRDDRNYYDRGWHSNRRYVRVRGYDDYYYYYPNNPRRYYRDRYYDRHYRNWQGRYGYDRWDRRRDRYDRWERRDDRRNYRRGGATAIAPTGTTAGAATATTDTAGDIDTLARRDGPGIGPAGPLSPNHSTAGMARGPCKPPTCASPCSRAITIMSVMVPTRR
jgi:hypothetical protein